MQIRTEPDSPVTVQKVIRTVWKCLLRRAGLLAIAAILAAVAVIITAAASNPLFRSEAEVTSLFNDDAPRALGLAGLSGTTEKLSPGLRIFATQPRGQLFPLILRSRQVTRKVLTSRYHYQIDDEERFGDLHEYLGVRNKDAAEIVLKSRVVSYYLDPKTGVTRIVVDTRSPELSRQIVERYIGALEEALNSLRERDIRLTLTTIEEKLNQANTALAMNENALKTLSDKNRDFDFFLDPKFYFQQIQLQREIEMYETLVVALKSQYELTLSQLFDRDRRLTVVKPPTLATTYIHPRWKNTMFLSLAVALVTALLGAGILAAADLAPPLEKQRWTVLLYVLKKDVLALLAGRPALFIRKGRAAR